MDEVRAHILISGSVQGVFFRYSTRIEAEERNIRGWVKNLANSQVEAIFEGNKGDVLGLIDWCHKGPPGAVVRHVDIEWQAYKGEFDSFLIK